MGRKILRSAITEDMIKKRVHKLFNFGKIGIILCSLGFLICVYLTGIWCLGASIGDRPLLLFGVLLLIIGIQFFSTRLLPELMTLKSRKFSIDPQKKKAVKIWSDKGITGIGKR